MASSQILLRLAHRVYRSVLEDCLEQRYQLLTANVAMNGLLNVRTFNRGLGSKREVRHGMGLFRAAFDVECSPFRYSSV